MDQTIKTLAKKNNWIIIGISGCTNSGKTTICESLKEKFDSVQILNQDKYFRQEDDPNHIWVVLKPSGQRHQNWESLQSVNWNKMMLDIQEIVSKCPNNNNNNNNSSSSNRKDLNLLIIDGHVIFNYKPLANIFDKKYFLMTKDKEKILQRRIYRDYIPADPPGYYDQWVWPMYLKNLKDLEDQKNIDYIDGETDLDTICKIIHENLNKFIKNHQKNSCSK